MKLMRKLEKQAMARAAKEARRQQGELRAVNLLVPVLFGQSVFWNRLDRNGPVLSAFVTSVLLFDCLIILFTVLFMFIVSALRCSVNVQLVQDISAVAFSCSNVQTFFFICLGLVPSITSDPLEVF